MAEIRHALSLNAFQGATRSKLDANTKALLARREKNFGAASVLFYREPLQVVRAEGAWMYTADGRRYLDAYNNVPSIGHSHPRVAEAIAAQSALVNTSTRYLNPIIETYAERLKATLPKSLSNVALTCSGSEANDLAMRIARYATGGEGFIVTESAYHGNTTAVTEISPSALKPGKLARHVRAVPAPGRAAYGADVAGGFAKAVQGAIKSLAKNGIRTAALICDSIFSSDGVFADPKGIMAPAVKVVREAGALFIADEVQPGFGRTGDHLWGFGRHKLTPDIVTMGKPMGNGYPIAGLATRPALLSAYCEEVGYFNTFGGNPVAAAAGLAVLDVIRDEGVQANSKAKGAELRGRIAALANRYPRICEVRGAGLFIGVEFSQDGDLAKPDQESATRVINAMRDRGVLIGAAGRFGNILKIRPPLCITAEQVDLFMDALEDSLATE